MKRYITPLILLLLVSLSACREQSIPTFGEEKFVYFDKFWMDELSPGTNKADSTGVTFFFEKEDALSVNAKLIVVLAGRSLEKDLPFRLEVVDKYTTAQPNEYTLQDSYTFRAKPVNPRETRIQDTISIQINRSERLNTLENGYRLALRIVPSDQVKVGQYERSIAILHVTKDPMRPDWWDGEISAGLLGNYSPLKYKLFVTHVPGATVIDANYIVNHPDRVRKLVLEFKRWLALNPTFDEANNEMMRVMV